MSGFENIPSHTNYTFQARVNALATSAASIPDADTQVDPLRQRLYEFLPEGPDPAGVQVNRIGYDANNSWGSYMQLESHSSGLFPPPVTATDGPTSSATVMATGNDSLVESGSGPPSLTGMMPTFTHWNHDSAPQSPYTCSSQASESSGLTRSTTGHSQTQKCRKIDLVGDDKKIHDRAADLFVVEIINELGWSNSDDMRECAMDCVSRAVAEIKPDPASSIDEKNILKLLNVHRQSLRGNMVKKALYYARQYNLAGAVNPDKKLSADSQVAAAKELCEVILDDKNWKQYFLHNSHPDQEMRELGLGVDLFAHPIFKMYHKHFWYKDSLSPLLRGQPWTTPPLRLLASSATALACALRRVAEDLETPKKASESTSLAVRRVTGSSSKKKQQDPTLHPFEVLVYLPMERSILKGMDVTLSSPHPIIRHRFNKMIIELHQEGLALLELANPTTGPSFYIPTLQELQAPTVSESEPHVQDFFIPFASQSSSQTGAAGLGMVVEDSQVVTRPQEPITFEGPFAAEWTLGAANAPFRM
ncbi:hypothetical protein JVU11DRAFT_10888 [Chiua virens]|nr:hypothetical protein JVU11DRAFT_10888 [Chiua virens]